MLVFLSCTKDNDFFLKAAEEAKKRAMDRIGPHIELFHPPSAGISGTGSVLGNVARILFADLILMDVTPEGDEDSDLFYNPGVMIEFGMVAGQELTYSALSLTGGTSSSKKPNIKVFSNSVISRSRLTPILNDTDVIPYGTNEDEKEQLITKMLDSIMDTVGKKLDMP